MNQPSETARQAANPPPSFFRYLPGGKKRPSEYEELTLHTQWSPSTFATQGFFCRGAGGRDVWDSRSTRVTCSDWWKYRDPNKLWYNPYVEIQARSEDMIELAFEGARLSGGLDRMSTRWRETLGRYYAAYRFFEYGLFLSLSYVQREALSDIVGTTAVFEGMDRDRHAQAIALYCMDLEAALPGFSDKPSREAWMTDPLLVPTREYVERLMACRDWMEILVAIDLVLEPLVAVPWSRGFFARFAAEQGDTVTTAVLDTVEVDRKRHFDTIEALTRFVIADNPENRPLLQGWVDLWLPRARAAQKALKPLFDQFDPAAFQEESAKANRAFAALAERCGLTGKES